MATRSAQQDAARAKAEQLMSQKKHQEAERLMTQERDRKAFDDKTARLRALRLAKETADRSAGSSSRIPGGKAAKHS